MAVVRHLIALGLCLGALAHPPVAHAQPACEEVAQKAADDARDQGLPPLQVERAYGAALLTCRGVDDPGRAAIAAAVDLEYARLARLFLAQRLPTALYLQLVRDRSAKLRLASRDAGYRAAWQAGDADNDFVPDDRDKCPRSPELTATGRDGCPIRPTPGGAPSDEAMALARRALRGIGLVSNPACADAPVPDRAGLLHQGFLRPGGDPATHFYGVAVSSVRNVAAGCGAWYQFNFRFSERTDATFPETKIIQVTFADAENMDMPAQPGRRIFKVFAADTGRRLDLFRSAVKYGRVEWRVRTIGANGLISNWSEWRHEAFNGVFRPD